MRCILIAGLVAAHLCSATDLAAQGKAKTETEKATKRVKRKRQKNPQYKRIHQKILKALVNGKLENARKTLKTHVERNPSDPEHWFLVTLVEAGAGNLEEAVVAMHRAIDLGLPPARFLAGPRNLLAPIRDTQDFKTVQAEFEHRPVHGPMLGDLSGTSVKVWLRTATASSVEVIVRRRQAEAESTAIVARGKTEARHDFTGVVQVNGLRPETRYTYELRISGGDVVPGGSFCTFPEIGSAGKFTIAFGGGAGFVPEHERMWNTIASFHPDALLLLGDNVYIDAPEMREMQDFCYYRRQSRPEFRKLIASLPVYTIWDDHDFGVNDCWYGADVAKPEFKPKVFQVFRQNWVNPGYGTEGMPGCFYEFHIGDLYFMMLDGRYYRSDPKSEKPSMLGAGQNAWLRDRLGAARGKFVMINSPVPWVFEAKGNSRDTWNGFHDERDAIFDFLRTQKKEGVVLMSADRHRTDIWNHPANGHYPFTEFNSSRLTNQHVHPKMRKAEFSYNASQSFGIMEFDTTLDDPSVTMKVINIDGELLYTKVLRRSQVSYR